MAKSILNEDLVQKIFGKGEPVKEENVFFLEECQRRKAKKTEQLRALNPQVIKILREATHNPDLLESIKERASIRWSDGLSDSLYEAVLCNIEPIEEKPERDAGGKIILRPCTDWDMELKKF